MLHKAQAEQAFLGDSTVMVRPIPGACGLRRLEGKTSRAKCHHGPPHDLGWIALGPSEFALDGWRPQRNGSLTIPRGQLSGPNGTWATRDCRHQAD